MFLAFFLMKLSFGHTFIFLLMVFLEVFLCQICREIGNIGFSFALYMLFSQGNVLSYFFIPFSSSFLNFFFQGKKSRSICSTYIRTHSDEPYIGEFQYLNHRRLPLFQISLLFLPSSFCYASVIVLLHVILS